MEEGFPLIGVAGEIALRNVVLALYRVVLKKPKFNKKV
jgi:hypothetical protein